MKAIGLISIVMTLVGCAGFQKTEYTLSWAPQDAGIEYVELDDETTLRYLHAGEGPPLVLIHTIRTQIDYFQNLITPLSRHFSVYAIDLPGHGYSSIGKVDYTEAYYREVVIKFIRHLQLEDVTLVGESIGGVLVLSVAANLPSHIKRVYTLNPYDYGKHYGGGIRRSSVWGSVIVGSFGMPVIGAVSSRMENKFFLRKVLQGGLVEPDNLPPQLLAEFNNVGHRPGYRHVERSTFKHWRSWVAARAYYGQITVPVTLLYGEHDWSYPEERAATHAMIAGSKMVTLAGAGHFATLEAADEIGRIIIADTHGM